MKIVIAIDSFKGSVTSLEGAEAIKQGIIRVYPDAEIVTIPVADGGEGTSDALISGMGGEKITLTVTGPLGEPVEASYGIIGHTGTAVIEMAQAAGLPLVPKELRDPMKTTTYGVGEMINDAINRGCRNFIIGIGGSATNDCGVGMLKALGWNFVDIHENDVKPGAEGLRDICFFESDKRPYVLYDCTFNIACDVNNPLCGERGCTYVYAPQKGATPEMLPLMDKWIEHFADLTEDYIASSYKNYPGAGAAGGLGFAFKSFLNGELLPGVEIVLRETGFYDCLDGADLVITGEGRLDAQTVMGKAPAGVAKAAKERGIPVIAFSGCVTEDAVKCNEHGIDAFFPILRRVVSEAEAMDTENTKTALADTAEQVMRLIKTFKKEN